MEVVTAALTGPAVGVDSRCWEDPLPWPFVAGVLILFDEGVGEGHMAGAVPDVPLVLDMDAFEMIGEALAD